MLFDSELYKQRVHYTQASRWCFEKKRHQTAADIDITDDVLAVELSILARDAIVIAILRSPRRSGRACAYPHPPSLGLYLRRPCPLR